MSTTFAALVTRIQISLNDEAAATWDTEMLATFLNDAIRDYSNHFPIQATDSISTSDGFNNYSLNADFMNVISVEFPDGETPRAYLDRRPYTHPDFWTEEGYYDIIHNSDDTAPDQIIPSTEQADGQIINVQYHAHHPVIANTASISGNCTVPPYHQHLLIAYVRWQASLHLASKEQQTPTSNSSLLMAQLAQNARRDALTYSTSLQQAIYAADGKESQQRPWATQGTGVERIY